MNYLAVIVKIQTFKVQGLDTVHIVFRCCFMFCILLECYLLQHWDSAWRFLFLFLKFLEVQENITYSIFFAFWFTLDEYNKQ